MRRRHPDRRPGAARGQNGPTATGSFSKHDSTRRCQIVYHVTKPVTNSTADPTIKVISAIDQLPPA